LSNDQGTAIVFIESGGTMGLSPPEITAELRAGEVSIRVPRDITVEAKLREKL
jgi:hypothetical protein